MAFAANAFLFRKSASFSDDPLFHGLIIAKASSSSAAAAISSIPSAVPCHDHRGVLFSRCALSQACRAGCTSAIKPLGMDRTEKQQQVLALESLSRPRAILSNPCHGLSSDDTVLAEVDSCRLMLPWLVSDRQFSSSADQQLDWNCGPVLCKRYLSPSELDGSSSQVIAHKVVSGFPVASLTSTRVSSTTPSAPTQKQESPGRDGYHVNIGYAIRSLREELPSMFYKDLNYEFYREDIVFRDPLNIFHGIENYKLIFWALRFHGQIFFRAIWVDVLSVWQPSERVISVRWAVRGIPRIPWEAQGRFDGISKYKMDKDGKIYEHEVDNIVISSPPKFKSVTVLDLARIAGVQTTPTPTYFREFCYLSTHQCHVWCTLYG